MDKQNKLLAILDDTLRQLADLSDVETFDDPETKETTHWKPYLSVEIQVTMDKKSYKMKISGD